jgi:hypothetical protein
MRALSIVEVEEVSGGELSLGQVAGLLVTGGYMRVGLSALGRFISSGGSPDYSRVTSHGDMY